MVKALAKRTLRAEHRRFLSWYRHRFGLISAVFGFAGMLRNHGIAKARNHLTGGTISLRPGTVDQVIYDEVFLREDLDIEIGHPRVIVDAGAHIGMASVYFASRFPDATVIAIEPEQENFRVLCRNAEAWPNIHPVHAALWSGPGELGIDNEGVESRRFRVSERSGKRNIPALGVPDIKRLFRLDHIDVLKLDIEGSEIEVFRNSDEWMPSIGNMIVELHDRLRPGCARALDNALSGYEFQRNVSWKKTVITDIRQRPELSYSAPQIPWMNCHKVELAIV